MTSLNILSSKETATLSMITHDLKSPMNAILGVSQFLEENIQQSHPDAYSEYTEEIDILLEAGREMVTSINQILTLSKSLAQEGLIKPIKISHNEIENEFQKLKTTFRHEFFTKKINFAIHIHGQLPHLTWDMPKLRLHVFNNIISNAIRFTPLHGTINVHIKNKNSHIQIIITDSGEGILKEHWDSVFLPYEPAILNLGFLYFWYRNF